MTCLGWAYDLRSSSRSTAVLDQEELASSLRWRKAVLEGTATVRQAIRSLDASGLQIVLVLGSDGTLCGTLTDGDIRRGLIRGLDLDSPVESILTHEPLVVPQELTRDTVLQLMQMNKIRQLPVVDMNRRVVGLHIWDDLCRPVSRPNLMVIMAGGQGTRLRPYTENCPKPMLPVGGKPMLEHIIERAKGDGFRRFVISTHYLGQMIQDYFGSGERWGVRIDYLCETSPLGTAGAIGLLAPRPDAPFIVSNGDVLTDVRYGEMLDFHCRHNAAATMAVRLYEWQHPFGVVHTDGVDIVGFEEKPVAKSHVNAGIYVLEPTIMELLTSGQQCDMPSLFERVRSKRIGRTIVYPMHEPWLDVGREADLHKARANMRGQG